MLLCRRILFQLEFGTLRRFASTQPLRTSSQATSREYVRERFSTIIPGDQSLQRLVALASSNPEERSSQVREGVSDLRAYKHLRIVDRRALASLPMASYFALLEPATELGLNASINELVEDILEWGPKNERVSAVLQIMSSPTLPQLPLRLILPLLQCLEDSRQKFTPLELRDVAVLVHTFAVASRDSVEKPLVDIIFPLLLARLNTLSPPVGDAVLTYQPPDIVHATFSLIDKLLHLSQEQRVLDLFQILVQSGNIPSEAVQTRAEVDGFQTIVRSSLVRASIHWNWRGLAERLLSPLLTVSPPPSPRTISLAIDTIYACLDDATPADLNTCRVLIMKVHPYSPVPDAIIRQFYDTAEQVDARNTAHAFYAFTRSKEVMEVYWYPCPRATSLAWLLRYLLETNSYHAMFLAQDVLDKNLTLPVHSRPYIVEELASRGYASIVRPLWSKYAVGKDRDLFVGNPGLMLRVVSLFHHLASEAKELLETKAPQSPEVLDDARARAQEHTDFMNFVSSEYTRTHSPLADAHHHVVTAQARAYFILGQYNQGFDMVKLLLDRKEMPDLYDINVILTVMAEQDPGYAHTIIQRMIEKGLQPDHITYGTVMHHAFEHGDIELVNEMVQQTRLLNRSLSSKSIVALVRGSISFDAASSRKHLAQHSKLRSAFSIIQAVSRSTVLRSVPLGKFLVLTCLRAEAPTMAFKFWQLVLMPNANPLAREQFQLRNQIKRSLGEHLRKGRITESHVRAMLSQLEEVAKVPTWKQLEVDNNNNNNA
ncbi:hypothetical protein DFH06DRAFT_1096375 [Mycena polygramma]|nr:hypothetical protein DFH06DRAFT_1096375 [Mycena polygramma]